MSETPQHLKLVYNAQACASGEATCQYGRLFLPPGGKTYTRADRVALAEMIQREEGTLGPRAMEAAAWVALNRFIKQNYEPYDTLLDTIADPGQFQAYTDKTDEPSDEAYRIVRDIMRGEIPDPISGYIFFGNSSPTLEPWIMERAVVLHRVDPEKYKYIKVEGNGEDSPLYIFSYNYTDSDLEAIVQEQKEKEQQEQENQGNPQ